MRHLIFAATVVISVVSANFWQGILSGGASFDASASAAGSGSGSGSGSNWLSGIQNSSFGQAVSGGIDFYNQQKNKNKNSSSDSNWQTAISNSSIGNFYQQGVDFFNGMKNGNQSFIDTDAVQQSIGNSSFGSAVQSGIEFYNSLKNGQSPFKGDESSIMDSFVPFLSNASPEAKTEFYTQILPDVGNMTIAEWETAVNAWAAKYGMTAEVDAFTDRAKNASEAAEEHANAIIMNLPNVLNNLKSIAENKNQTVSEMHSAIIAYVNSLDEDTRDIVFIFFRNLLPPNFKKSKCIDNGNFMTNMYQGAMDFFNGGGKGQKGNGTNGGFPDFGQVFTMFNGNGNGKDGNGNDKPHPMIGMISNFFNKNNISEEDANAAMSGMQQDGNFASIQILPAASINLGNAAQVDLTGGAKIAVMPENWETKTTKKNKKQQNAKKNNNKNKNKKKTTVAPVAVDANIAAEVHTQIL